MIKFSNARGGGVEGNIHEIGGDNFWDVLYAGRVTFRTGYTGDCGLADLCSNERYSFNKNI